MEFHFFLIKISTLSLSLSLSLCSITHKMEKVSKFHVFDLKLFVAMDSIDDSQQGLYRCFFSAGASVCN